MILHILYTINKTMKEKGREATMKNKKQIIFNLVFVLFLINYLWFVLSTGYWSDDRKYEFMHGILNSSQWNIVQFIWERIRVHVELHGRFFPVTSVFAEGIPFLLGLGLYKIYLVFVILGCVILFKTFVHILFRSEALANLAALMSVVLFSVQNGMSHAVFLCMGGNAIISVIFLLLSLIFCVLSSRRGRKRDEVLSIFFFTLSMLTYEVAYPFILLIILVVLYENPQRQERIRRITVFFIVWLVILGVYGGMKFFAHESYDGISVGFSVRNIVRGFLVSITAPLPFVSWLFREHAAHSLKDFFQLINMRDIILAVLFLYLYLQIIKERAIITLEKNKRFFFLLVGILFVCFPAMLMAISEKYQILPPGIGYQVIIYQYFGWGCIGAFCISCIWNIGSTRCKRIQIFNGVAILIGVCLIFVNQMDTRWTIRELELREPSITAEFDQSLRNAFGDNLAEEMRLDAGRDLIVSPKQYYGVFARGAMLKELTGEDYQWAWYEEIDNSFLEKQVCYAFSSGSGWVMSGEVSELKCEDDTAIVKRVWLYCDGSFDRLMSAGENGIEFFMLEDADEVKKCSKGTLFVFDNLTCDINKLLPVNYYKYKLGTKIPVADTRRDCGAFFYGGISNRENGFTWSSGKTADAYFELEDNEYENIKAEIDVKMVYGEEQPVDIFVNDIKVYSDVQRGGGGGHKIKF